MQASNEQKQERTEKMIVLKKSPKWWATAAATGGLVVGMTSGFGLGMLGDSQYGPSTPTSNSRYTKWQPACPKSSGAK